MKLSPLGAKRMTSVKYRLFSSFALALIGFCLCFFFADNAIGYCGDDVQIIHQSIVALKDNIQQFINDYTYMNANNVDVVATNAYSWGTSFILVPIYKLFGLGNILMFKIVMIISFAAFLFIFSLYLSKKTNVIVSSLITLFIATCPFFITFSNDILKDLPFLLVSFICFIAIDSFLKEEVQKKQILYSLFVSLMLSLCVLFRENGGLMVIVLLFSQVVRIIQITKSEKKIDKYTYILFLLPYILTAGAYYLVSSKYPTFYQSELLNYSPMSMVKMTLYYLNQIKTEFFNLGNIFSFIFLIGIFFLFIIGLIKKYKQEYVAVIMLCTLFGYIVCPVEQGVRYIIPLLPFVFIFVGFAVASFKYLNLKLALLLLVVLNVFNVYSLSKMNLLLRFQYKDVNHGVTSVSAKELYNYIRENTPRNSKIIYWHPRAIYMYTGRLSFQISDKKEKLKNADYQVSIIGDDKPGSFYDKEMYDYTEKTYVSEADVYLIPVYRNTNYAMYKITKDSKK